MKIDSIILLVCTIFMFGCTSTTIKSYSTDFKVWPVETKDVGNTITTPDGTEYTVKQQYKFEGVITETTQTPDGETISREIKTPTVQTQLGSEATVRIKQVSSNGKADPGEISLEVLIEENENETHAYLKALYKEHDSEPIISNQDLIMKK